MRILYATKNFYCNDFFSLNSYAIAIENTEDTAKQNVHRKTVTQENADNKQNKKLLKSDNKLQSILKSGKKLITKNNNSIANKLTESQSKHLQAIKKEQSKQFQEAETAAYRKDKEWEYNMHKLERDKEKQRFEERYRAGRSQQ